MISHVKDTKAICRHCKDIIFVFSRDIKKYEQAFRSDQIYDNQGQAPWLSGDRLRCRKCNRDFNQKSVTYEAPHV